MTLYQLEQQDINDLLGMITSDALPIKASRAARVFQLQALLSNAKPVVREGRNVSLEAASIEQLNAELALRSEPPF